MICLIYPTGKDQMFHQTTANLLLTACNISGMRWHLSPAPFQECYGLAVDKPQHLKESVISKHVILHLILGYLTRHRYLCFKVRV